MNQSADSPQEVEVPQQAQQWDLQLCSPSKINLFLRILGRRQDGFHDLASLFQAISLHDNMSFRVKEQGSEDSEMDTLECSCPGVPLDGSNLILKALEVFRARTGVQTRFHIHLTKNVPVQAGLGGGSGNAATALWAANILTKAALSNDQLAQLGAEFGSDISFFFSRGTAYCTGRGEILKNLKPFPPMSMYIVKPPEGLSTKDVFQNLDLSTLSEEEPEPMIENIRNGPYWATYVNDLEKPSFELLPRLKELKSALVACGFRVVMMSGSGTAFFCLGEPSTSEVDKFQERIERDFGASVLLTRFAHRWSDESWYLQPRTEPLEPLRTPPSALG